MLLSSYFRILHSYVVLARIYVPIFDRIGLDWRPIMEEIPHIGSFKRFMRSMNTHGKHEAITHCYTHAKGYVVVTAFKVFL